MKVSLTVNGSVYERDVPSTTLLVELIRNHIGLTGTHVGCDTSQCGACTVHVDGRSVKSCTMLAMQAEGRSVTTIEGIGSADALHPMQAAFRECHALQCGFCTPGMIMSCAALLNKNPNPTLDDVKHATRGNLCRCGTYPKVFEATLEAAKKMKKGGTS